MASSGRSSVANWQSRALAWLYERLYHELAWAYDPISWLVSGGRWRAWQRVALPYVKGNRVLEVGCGPGHVLRELALAGYDAVGVDLSPAMWTRASARLAQAGRPGLVVAADGRALPFASDSFDSVLLTFPTPIVFDRATWIEAARVLRPEGRVVVVLGARSNARWWPVALERALTLLGHQPMASSTAEAVDVAGLAIQRLNLATPRGTVYLLLAEHPRG